MRPETRKSDVRDEVSSDIGEASASGEVKPAEREETVEDILKVPDDGEFYTLPVESGNLLPSVLSLLFAILSVVFFSFFYVGGIICAVLAIILAVVSSKKLGFFDRMALFGLIFGLFGLVFGIFSMIVDITGILDRPV